MRNETHADWRSRAPVLDTNHSVNVVGTSSEPNALQLPAPARDRRSGATLTPPIAAVESSTTGEPFAPRSAQDALLELTTKTLRHCGGDKCRTAALLGIGRRTLDLWLEGWGIKAEGRGRRGRVPYSNAKGAVATRKYRARKAAERANSWI